MVMNCLWVHSDAREMWCLGIATGAVVRRDGMCDTLRLCCEIIMGGATPGELYGRHVTSCPGNNWFWIPMVNFSILGEMHQACSSHRVQGWSFFLASLWNVLQAAAVQQGRHAYLDNCILLLLLPAGKTDVNTKQLFFFFLKRAFLNLQKGLTHAVRQLFRENWGAFLHIKNTKLSLTCIKAQTVAH